MGRKSREKWERRLELARAGTVASPPEKGLLAFLEHGWMLTIFSIIGGAVGLIWFPGAVLIGVVSCGAFHRVGVVREKSWTIALPSYILVFVLMMGICFGAITLIRKTVHIPTVQEIANAVWSGHTTTTPSIVNNNFTTISPASEAQVLSLKQKTNILANQILDFVYDREGPINQWKQEAMAQSVLDAIDHTSRVAQFQEKLRQRNEETRVRFLNFYWPQVLDIQSELVSAGVSDAPIQRAVALDGPRKVGLMLSVMGSQIGKKPPFPRVLTPTEARVIVQGSLLPNVEVYALLSDANSREIAEIIRREIEKQHVPVNGRIYPLSIDASAKPGISLIYPSADWTTELNNLIPAFEESELQVNWAPKQMKQPPSILKIEVRPQSSDWRPNAIPPSLIVR
jgi:hypothetical protein